jgi:hypothetical protein
MTDRFNMGPLLAGVAKGLRHRANVGTEQPDLVARAVLLGVPVAAGVASWMLGWQIRKPEVLIAGYSLLAASLLAVFSQLASWRGRLEDRAVRFKVTEGRSRRAVDEAVAHTLMAALGSMLAAFLMVILANILPEAGVTQSSVLPWFASLLTAASVAVGGYLLLTFLIIVNLLWDAYQEASKESNEKGQRGVA